MKNVPKTETMYYQELTKAARLAYQRLSGLPLDYRASLAQATMDSGGARGDAIRQLVHLAEKLNELARDSVSELDEVMAFGILPELEEGTPISPEWIRR